MSDIQEPMMNRLSSIEQVQQVKIPTAVQENQRLGSYMDSVLGAEGQAARGGVSLDAVMSGCLNGYLGLGDTAFEGLDGSLASAEILNKKSEARVSAAVGTPTAILEMKASETLASFDAQEVSEVALGLVPGVGLNVALDAKPNPVALTEIMKGEAAGDAAFKSEHRQAMGNIETLAQWEMDTKGEIALLENVPAGVTEALARSTPEKNDLTLNLKAGEAAGVDELALNLKAGQAAGVDELSLNLKAGQAAGVDDLALNLKAGEAAGVDELSLNLKAGQAVQENELALNLKANEAFDVRPMVGRPIIEGARKDYGSMFGQIHETLSRYDGNGNNGMVGVADFLGVPSMGNQTLGLDQSSPLSPLGMRAMPATQLMSHQSIISNELFGFLDLSSYTQSVGMGVNPTSTTAMLKPAKYLSNLVDGYYM